MRHLIFSMLFTLIYLVPITVSAGDIDSPGPPLSGSGMYTIEDIYNYLIDGTEPTISSTFMEPTAGPGPTMKTTKDIYDETKAKFDSCDATPDQVMDTVTFFSTGSGNWGPRSGSLTTKTLSGATTIVEAGYYEAATLNAVDPDLDTGNIRSGVNIFGVEGDPNVVDTGSGNATHADILSGRKAWVDGSQVIGTFACPDCPDAPTGNAQVGDVLSGQTFSNASSTGLTGTMPNRGAVNYTPTTSDQTIDEGYHNGSGVVGGDADLAAGNIKSGVNIFGVGGTYTCPPACTGDAAVGDVLSDKTFSNASSTGLTGTMTNVGQKIITPTTTNQAITQGYHDGTGYAQGDADLVTGNIKAGTTIFGVAGDSNVVDTTEATNAIVAGRMKTDDVGFVNGAKITGNGTKTLTAANDTVPAGYYEATTLNAVDSDLAEGNIKSGVTIFGVTGGCAYTTIVAWGNNGYGQCNVPAPNSGFVAVAAGGYHSLGLKSDGTIVAWGYNGSGQCNVPAPNSGFVAVAGGEDHSLGLK